MTFRETVQIDPETLTREHERLKLQLRELEHRLDGMADNAVQLTMLYETALVIMDENEPDVLLRLVLNHACQILDTQDAYVSLLAEGERSMCVRIAVGKFEQFLDYRSEKGRGLNGEIWETGEARIMDDYSQEVEWANLKGRVVSRLGLPLKIRENVIGVIGLGFSREHGQLSESVILVLNAFAQLAALGLMKARLHQDSLKEIEERRRAETALLESKRRYKNLAAVSPVGITRTDPEGHIVYVNERWAQILGLSIGHILGKKWYGSMLAEEQGIISSEWKDVISEQGTFSGEFRFETGRSSTIWIFAQFVAELDEQKQVQGYIGTFTDINARKQAEEMIRYQALHDGLTGLANRELLQDRLQNELFKAERSKKKLALLFLDLDRFKEVNDNLGHATGDWLLVETAHRLSGCLRKSDTIARHGGDEFIILLPELEHRMTAGEIARKILSEIRKKFEHEGNEFHIGVSVGISVYPDDGDNADVLMRNADAALYSVKEQGRNSFEYFTESLNIQSMNRFRTENLLRNALENNEFELHYQPRLDLDSYGVTGVEALLRWRQRGKSPVLPLEFIEIAEESGLMLPIGEWVLRRAARDMKELREMGFSLMLAVNYSPRQFHQPHLHKQIADVLMEEGFPFESLELEITEKIVGQDYEGALASMHKLKEIGVKVSIDDFGTGCSSLSYLKELPLDILKVDQCFVQGVPLDAGNVAILKAIILMSRSMNYSVIAKGVENKEQMEFLHSIGCAQIQGRHFQRPLSFDKLTRFLKKRMRP